MRRARKNRSRCHNTLIHRWAKALALVLGKMGIFIRNHERIVGYQTADPNGLFHPIDQNWRSVKRLVNSEAGRTLLDDKDRREFDELCAYWEGKCMSDRHQAVFTGDLPKYWKYEGTSPRAFRIISLREPNRGWPDSSPTSHGGVVSGDKRYPPIPF